MVRSSKAGYDGGLDLFEFKILEHFKCQHKCRPEKGLVGALWRGAVPFVIHKEELARILLADPRQNILGTEIQLCPLD